MLSAKARCDRNVENSSIDPIKNIAIIQATLLEVFGTLLI
jgi:hypothetical protein